MSSLLESLARAFPTEVVGQIGKVAGLDPDLVHKGLNVVGPVITGALAQKASTPEGLASLVKMLPSGEGANGLAFNDLLSMLKPGASKGMLSGVFGPGTGAVGATLDRALGFNVSSLLGAAVPVVLGFVSKAMHAQKLDPNALAALLQNEQSAFAAKGGDTAGIVTQALDAGKQAAAVKDRYTPEEWEQVRMAPVAAAHAVMLSSPSGVVGTVQEVGSVLHALHEGRKGAAPTSLVQVAFGNDVSKDEFVEIAKAKSPAAVLALVKGAVAVVATKNPADLASYKSFVLGTAQKTAEAAKEGGFFGIGGTKVSKEEQATLDQLKTVLG